ncbi:MAG: large conductance mechanosensitive channel protein MscL [Actinomycetota bacterium]
MLKEFRAFVLRGNVVDLAVAVVIGAAFGAVVTSLVENVLTPIIAIPGDTPDLSGLTWTIGSGPGASVIRYGVFLNALISFLLIAAAVFFFVVKPINRVMERFKTEPEVSQPTKKCPECLSNIPRDARRCAFCSQPVGAEG